MAYADEDDLNLAFGEANVQKWADVNNDENASDIAARITWALDLATADVDLHLHGGPYEVPFDSPPSIIVELTAKLAGIKLYESRGIEDAGGEHNLSSMKRMVVQTLYGIRWGQKRLNLTQGDNAPFVGEDE